MFELIKLNPDDITFEYQNKSQTMYFWVENMFTDAIMNQENFTRTLATVNNSRVEDLEQRSSWTHNKTFDIKSPDISSYFGRAMCPIRSPKEDPHNESRYQLLKYEKGDFFNKHLDRKQTPEHEYTCLIIINDKENEYEGGELILTDQDNIYNIHVSEACKLECVMIIFSIDLYHEITPITKGARYVFKKPMYDYVYKPKSNENETEKSNEEDFKDFWKSVENDEWGGLHKGLAD